MDMIDMSPWFGALFYWAVDYIFKLYDIMESFFFTLLSHFVVVKDFELF